MTVPIRGEVYRMNASLARVLAGACVAAGALVAGSVAGLATGLAGAQAQRGSLEWRIEELAGLRVADVRSLLTLLKQRVNAGDRQGVCALVAYPLATAYAHARSTGEISNSARCVREYTRLFNDEVVSAIAKQRFEDLFTDWQGITIGDDDVRIAGICRDTDCIQYDLRIVFVSSGAVLRGGITSVQIRDVLSGPLSSPRWVTRQGPPSREERECTDYSRLFWTTSVKSGVPHATRDDGRDHTDPVPFKIGAGRDRFGERWTAQVPDGWIVGFDGGEFGGGLWWFNPKGTESRRIRPGASAPVNPDDPFRAENVVGLPSVGGERLVLMGLDHLTGRSGRIFRLVSGKGGWSLDPVVVLDASPDVWLVDGGRLLVLTESGLWSIEATGNARRIHQTDSGFLASTMVRASDGALYVGLRHYVLKLDELNGEWRETWFTPSVCMKVEMTSGHGCTCAG